MDDEITQKRSPVRKPGSGPVQDDFPAKADIEASRTKIDTGGEVTRDAQRGLMGTRARQASPPPSHSTPAPTGPNSISPTVSKIDDEPTIKLAPVEPAKQIPVAGKRRKGRPRWVRVLLAISLLFLILAAGSLIYGYNYFENNVQRPLSKFIHPVSRGQGEPAINSTPDDGAIMGRSWNILLLGSDNDNKYNFPALLTQVMMIVHIDTVHNSVYMVSIPRDSWVYVPGTGAMHKIDQAFFIGATQHNSFDDGVRLARLTVEKDYGITIDRYAWVGLSGFASVIDTLGGVDIDVTHPILDDNYPDDTGNHPNDPYALERIYLAPGPQHLNGQEALEYVRSRHADLVGDIGRTERQQQVLTALKSKLNVASVFSNLHQLFADLSGNVYTDLSEQEMLAFANFGRTLNSSSIQHITFGPGTGNADYGDFATVYDPSVGADQDVVIPQCENIQPVMNTIFGLGKANSCNVTGP